MSRKRELADLAHALRRQRGAPALLHEVARLVQHHHHAGAGSRSPAAPRRRATARSSSASMPARSPRQQLLLELSSDAPSRASARARARSRGPRARGRARRGGADEILEAAGCRRARRADSRTRSAALRVLELVVRADARSLRTSAAAGRRGTSRLARELRPRRATLVERVALEVEQVVELLRASRRAPCRG